MNKGLALIFCLVSCLFLGYQEPLYSLTSSDEITEEQLIEFHKEMYEQLAIAQAKVEYYEKILTDRSTIASAADRAAFENALVMLDVKRSLVSNFTNAPSLRSALVREMLMRLLKADMIFASDLAELQNLVNREKERLGIPLN